LKDVRKEEGGGRAKDEFRRAEPGAEQENKPRKIEEVTESLAKEEGNKGTEEGVDKGGLEERPPALKKWREGKESGKQVVKEEGTEQGNVGGVEGQRKEMQKEGEAEKEEAGREKGPPSPKRVKSERAAEEAEFWCAGRTCPTGCGTFWW
jgi:hypothetical protein